MDILHVVIGYALGVLTAYFFFMVGRNTKYQDQNVIPPPSPAPQMISFPVPKGKISDPEKAGQVVGDLDEIDLMNMEALRRKGFGE